MLSPKQYEAIGRVALAFNDVEYALEVDLMGLLGTPESSVSVLLSEEGSFHQKTERIKRILGEIGQERDGLDAHIKTVIDLLGKAKNLAQRRNAYIHAIVVQDFRSKDILLRMRGNYTVCDEKEIKDLSKQLNVLWEELISAYGELMLALIELRESK